jgi:hypothetical protein
MQKNCVALLVLLAGTSLTANAAGAFTGDQYKKAAWMATRFYGAMRSGAGPNWILQETNYPTSFVKDSYNNQDISGGWFDCGDHVMFGQTQFYATYVLALSLETWPSGFWDLYNGTTYADYKGTNYAMDDGKPNGLKDLLEEIRYNADFLCKITPDEQTFVLQIGDGDLDHKKWVTAGKMASLNQADGGEADKPRPVVAKPSDANAPALAAAALAVMARIDPDATRRSKYLEHAKNAYAYSLTTSGVQSSPGGYYQADWWDGRWRSSRYLAGLELWRTTSDDSYKSKAIADLTPWVNTNEGMYVRFDYTNTTGLARILAKKYMPEQSNKQLNAYLASFTGGVDGNGVVTWSNYGFALRGPTGAAFLFALDATLNGGTPNDNLIFNQVDYILGKNSSNQAYLVGWDEAGKKSPPTPHHRGYWGNEDPAAADKSFGGSGKAAPVRNKYLGGVIPGAMDGSVSTDVTDWNHNEVCLEQNAAFVGALGYIVSKSLPSDPSTGISQGMIRTSDELAFTHQTGRIDVVAVGMSLVSGEAYDPSGRKVAVLAVREAGLSLPTAGLKAGLYLVRVRTADGQSLSRSAMVY